MKKSRVILRSTKDQNLKEVVKEVLDFCNWKELITDDSKVVIKANLCTEDPERIAMSNTDASLMRAVCELVVTRSKNISIIESDGARYSADDAFYNTGLQPLVDELGIKWVNLSKDELMDIDHPTFHKTNTLMARTVLEADVVINMPVIKTHALTVFTGSIKNLWGCVPRYDRIILHKYLDELLSDLPGILKPHINIMDGIICSEGRGPTNGTPRRLDLILGSNDPVALDALSMRLIGLDPFTSKHIVMSSKKGRGTIVKDEISIDGDFLGHKVDFTPPICDAAVRAMNYMTRFKWFTYYILFNESIFRQTKHIIVLLRKIGLLNDKPQRPTKRFG